MEQPTLSIQDKHKLIILKREYRNHPIICKKLEKAIDYLESANYCYESAVTQMQLVKASMQERA